DDQVSHGAGDYVAPARVAIRLWTYVRPGASPERSQRSDLGPIVTERRGPRRLPRRKPEANDRPEARVPRLICGVFLLVLAHRVVAQVKRAFADVSDEIEMVRSLVRMERKAAVEQAMGLTPAESQAFWALYNEYEAERTRVNDRVVKVVTDYAAAYPEVG